VAEAARRLIEASSGDGPLHSYVCDFCAGWHVGHVVWRPRPEADDRRDGRRRRGRVQRRQPGWLD
jgi:hypothetical protein